MSEERHFSFGCRLNAFESEGMRALAKEAGLDDAVVINTCAVTTDAVRQARQAIRRARRDHPDARIVVTGCAAQIDPDAFSAMEEVDAVLGNGEKTSPVAWGQLADAPRREESGEALLRVNDIMSVQDCAPQLVDGFARHARAFVQIQNGCNHRCTFCIIPYGRGNARSAPIAAVVDQVRRLVERGYNEVVFTGVDITSYGEDLPEAPSLGVLIETVLRDVPDLPRLRLSSLDTIEIDDRLFHLITEDARVAPHLHLSLQSGDDLILKRMKRRHSRDDAIAICAALRARRPEIAFGADIIAGFPTESEEMFENSLRLIEECGISYVHVFPYSPREGTPAARMSQLDRSVIKNRAARLRALADERLAAHLKARQGRTDDIVVERNGAGRASDFTPLVLQGAAADTDPGAMVRVRFGAPTGARLAAALA